MKLLASLRAIAIYTFAILLALYLGWWLSSKFDYGYDWLYKQMSIAEHIEKYAPQNNKGRANFVLASSDQHSELFAQTVDAVHSSGKGLTEIVYQVNGKSYPFYTQAEIIHLQDVANLINKIHYLALILLVALLLLLWRKPQQKASGKSIAAVMIGLIALIVALFLIIGATKIFYWLHVVVFPDNHQWFFYYQESLMSTSMKAPDLFLAIGGIIAVIAIPIFITFLLLINKAEQQRMN